MQKIHCYIDESGQDTKGALFVVSVIMTKDDRQLTMEGLEKIELQSGKGNKKWSKTKDAVRLAYIQAVFQTPVFRGKLFYGIHVNSQKYVEMTILTTAQAIRQSVQEKAYKATVIVDGLRDTERNKFASGLRELNIRTNKIRGINDENDILIRLADATCGFLRDALEGRENFQQLMKIAIRDGYLIQVGK